MNDKDLVICKNGGRVCLDEWVRSHLIQGATQYDVTYEIGAEEFAFTIYTVDGKVTDESGVVICE